MSGAVVKWSKEVALYVGLFIFFGLLIPSKHTGDPLNHIWSGVGTRTPVRVRVKLRNPNFGDLYYLLANYSQQFMNNESAVLNEIQKKQGIANPHPFNYTLLEKNVCGKQGEIFLLIVIHTAPDHLETRNRIRNSWAAPFLKKNLKVAVMFAVGLTSNSAIAQTMISESFHHRDMIQENFIDSYHNLTYKSVMWLNWTATFCPQAKYILKMDDDIFVNIFNLVRYLHEEHSNASKGQTQSQRKLYCYILAQMPVMRDPGSKWYASKDDYENDHYQIYCDGWAYIMTQNLILPLYEESFKRKFFWIDDVYVTGILPKNMDAKYININKYFSPGKQIPNGVLDGSLFFQIGGHHMAERVYFEQWRKLFPKDLVKENNAYYRALAVRRKQQTLSVKALAANKANNDTVENQSVDRTFSRLMY